MLRHWTWIVFPAPFLFEFFVNKGDFPSSLTLDFLENLKHFVLFAAIGQAFGSVCERANCDACDSAGR